MKENWLAIAAVACAVGGLFGYNIGAGGKDDDKVGERLGLIEERLTSLDGIEAVNANIEELNTANATIMGELGALKEGLAGLESGLDAFPASIGELTEQVSKLEGGSEAVREDVAAALTATSTAVASVTSEMQAVARGFAELKAAPVAAAPEAVAETVTENQPETETAQETDVAAEMRAAIGEEGMILSVGQTGVAGETRLFLSKLDDEAAHLVIVGGDRVALGKFDSPLQVAGGCAVSLEGVHERKAYLAVDCS